MDVTLNRLIKGLRRKGGEAVLRLGYQVIPFTPQYSETRRLATLLQHHGINQIFDVGANHGQFGEELRRSCRYRGEIVSFEPLKSAYACLERVASGDPSWHVAPRCALGAEEGEIEINVAGNSVSSSVLPMLSSHSEAAPQARYESVETVTLRRLDSVAPEYFRDASISFLKIDTQGYERSVLEGGHQTLARVRGVQLELSMIPLYEGQTLMKEMIEYVESAGFHLWSLAPAFVDPLTGRMLQADGIFFRND